MRIVFVTRQGCHLCDQGLQVLHELAIEPEIADVDADDELYRLYDWRVPVVLRDGVVIAEGRIVREAVSKALAAR